MKKIKRLSLAFLALLLCTAQFGIAQFVPLPDQQLPPQPPPPCGYNTLPFSTYTVFNWTTPTYSLWIKGNDGQDYNVNAPSPFFSPNAEIGRA
ncbi:MAG: hypothetical protein AAF570_27465, partial [Bacteroidota bacterium]